MHKPHHHLTVITLLAAVLLQGCAAGPFRLQYLWHNDPELSYYVDRASAIEYPVDEAGAQYEPNPELFNAPRNIRSLDEVDPWEVSLDECIKMALAHAAVIRDDASFGSPSNAILSRPSFVPSSLDPAIQQTGFLFGNRGYEAALADFDALATSTLTWGRDEVPQNAGTLGLASGQTQVNETFSWQTRLEKPLANGANISLQGDTNYDGNNRPTGSQLFPSSYTGLLQAEYRQPLWAGAGTEYTRIAGPLNQNLRGVSGVSQGVLISRINGDISLTQFEQSVATLVRDIELQYWDLNLFLRLYESERESFQQLLAYYNRLLARDESSVPVLAARARIYEADARMRGSLADVLEREARLRRLCHLPLSDGRFLYPSDEPSEALLEPSWDATMQEALSHRVELRRQKWEIKSLELQLKAARSLTRPRFDMVSQYRVNALGDHLAGNQDSQLDTMLGNLAGGQNTGWSIGFQMVSPVGQRLARIQVRNYELRLRKARAVLAEQEREIGYELAGAQLNMERWYELADSTTRRIATSEDHVLAVEQIVEASQQARRLDPGVFENLLNAKIQERDAQQAYMQSIIEYNKAIATFNFRKGTTLSDHAIYLAEGNWHPAAAPFAMQRAVHRTYAKDKPKLWTTPANFVGGFASSSWESLGLDTRPSIPGALDDAQQPTQMIPEVPEQPKVLEPMPVPPAEQPMADPPPMEETKPATEDVITKQRSLHNSLRSARGPSIQKAPEDNAGRVKL